MKQPLFLMLSLFAFWDASATILHVPVEYSSIHLANQAASHGDTVLLNHGNYLESATITHNLLITSPWIFSRDSLDRDSTILSPLQTDSSIIFHVSASTLDLAGFRFRSAQPFRSSRIADSPNTMLRLTMTACVIEGGIDTTRYYNGGLLLCPVQGSAFIGSNIRYIGNGLDGVPFCSIRGNIAITRSLFRDRIRDGVLGIYLISGIGDSISVNDCSFERIALGVFAGGSFLQVRRNVFHGTGEWTNQFSITAEGSAVVDSCLFDSSFSSQDYRQAVISFTNGFPRNPIVSNCVFTNANGIGALSLIESHERVFVRNCIFENNTGFIAMIASNTPIVESCRFLTNNAYIFVGGNNGTPEITVTNSDFLTTSNFFINRPNGEPFDTAFAPDNYWGDPTGPRHPLNPNGLGTILPSWANPFPFRTTPVFPENGINDPGTVSYSLPNSIELLPPYPNPFNASVTIRFRLPHSGDASIAIYDGTGREVATLQRGYYTAVEQSIQWRPQSLASGSYWIKAQSGNESKLVRIVHQK